MTGHTRTSVFLVDDHMVVIQGIMGFLADHPEFEVIGYATEGLDAVAQVKKLKPDVVVLDVNMPRFNGIEATYEILKSRPSTKVIVYTMSSEKQHVVSLFKAGVSAYVLKEDPLKDLIMALKAVENGGTYFSAGAEKHVRTHMRELELGDAARVMEVEDGIAKLSFREKEVFPLLADGRSIKEIADTLCISPKTVESHKYNIMEKLGVQNLAGLTKIAIKKHLIKIE